MKKVNLTLTLPKETVDLMNNLIGKGKLSVFAATALKNALDQKIEDLRREYELANKDVDRLELIKDWNILDGVSWDD